MISEQIKEKKYWKSFYVFKNLDGRRLVSCIREQKQHFQGTRWFKVLKMYLFKKFCSQCNVSLDSPCYSLRVLSDHRKDEIS